MDFDRWLQNTMKIQSIAAPTFHEATRANFILQELRSLKMETVFIDDDQNVFAKISGVNDMPLIVSAHLDSVFPFDTPLDLQQNDQLLQGPGIGDNAVALAALLELAHDLVETVPPFDVWLVANVCEEGLGNLRGMRTVVDRFGDHVLAYLVLEGMALGHIYHRALPIHRYRIQASTTGGHAWIHAGRPSAIHNICKIGKRLAEIELPEKPRWSLNIGQIDGGTSINTIAPKAWIELDLRAEDIATLAVLEERVHKATDISDEDNLSIEIERIGDRPAGEIPADHHLVLIAIHALEEVGIHNPQLEIGSTDASIPLSKNIPAVCIGLTLGSGAHSLEEQIEIQPMPIGYQALRRTIEGCFAQGEVNV